MSTLDTAEAPARGRFDLMLYGLLALAVVSMLLGWVLTGDEDSELVGWIVASVVLIAIALALWRFVVQPRLADGAPHPAPAIGFGIGAVVTVLAFWTGLPWVLGAVAIALGVVTRERGAHGPGTVGLALGTLAVVAATVINLVDWAG